MGAPLLLYQTQIRKQLRLNQQMHGELRRSRMMATNAAGTNNRAMAAASPSTWGVVGAIALWVVAIALSFITAATQDQPGGVWALRVVLMVAGVGYTIYLIIR